MKPSDNDPACRRIWVLGPPGMLMGALERELVLRREFVAHAAILAVDGMKDLGGLTVSRRRVENQREAQQTMYMMPVCGDVKANSLTSMDVVHFVECSGSLLTYCQDCCGSTVRPWANAGEAFEAVQYMKR